MCDVKFVLKESRKECGLSQESLARSAGVSVSVVRRLEQGGQEMTLETAARLCQALGLPLEKLAEASLESKRDIFNSV